ncbi:MAG: hypothetical protein ABI687_13020 [Flavitalea sp.]
MKIIILPGLCILMALISFKPMEPLQKVKDYLTIPGPIDFNKLKYHLSWSSHPSATYYKQEYIPENENADKFTKMMMIEAVTGNFSLQDVVKAKMAELEARKKNDPLANYQIIKNTKAGEFLLDFVISQSGIKEDIVEWNAYRYTILKEKSGKKGILLLACSKRAYGAATTDFLTSLKKDRPGDIKAITTYPVPVVHLIK